MNLEKINQWLMLAANLGVIAGIIFLAIEVNQNNQLLDAQTSITQMMFRVSVNERWADDAELMALRLKSSRNEPLTPLEQERLRFDARSVFAYWSWGVESFEGSETDLFATNNYVQIMKDYPYFLDSWRENRDSYPAEFITFMEENVISQLE